MNDSMADQDAMAAMQGWGTANDIDEVVAEELALFNAGRQAIIDCRDAIAVASSEIAMVCKGGLSLLHQVVGHVSTERPMTVVYVIVSSLTQSIRKVQLHFASHRNRSTLQPGTDPRISKPRSGSEELEV